MIVTFKLPYRSLGFLTRVAIWHPVVGLLKELDMKMKRFWVASTSSPRLRLA